MNIEFLPLPNGYEWYKCPLHSNTAIGGNQSHIVLNFKADWPFPVKEEIWTLILNAQTAEVEAMTDKEPTQPEMHEHPVFNGQYHQAVWVYQWSSDGATDCKPQEVY